jgi:hypothetical protein
MTKLSITLAITAAAMLGTTACERARTDDAARDVERARDDVRDAQDDVLDAQRDLARQRTDLSAEMQKALIDVEHRFIKLEKQASEAQKTREAAGRTIPAGADAELQQAQMLAKTKVEAARNAPPATVDRAIKEADEALDQYERKLRDHDRS